MNYIQVFLYLFHTDSIGTWALQMCGMWATKIQNVWEFIHMYCDRVLFYITRL